MSKAGIKNIQRLLRVLDSLQWRLKRKRDTAILGSAFWAERLGGIFNDLSQFRISQNNEGRRTIQLLRFDIELPEELAAWVLERNGNYAKMCACAEQGAAFAMEGGELIGMWKGAKFRLEPDTLLIFWELVATQSYRWADFGRQTLVFDIGANVGFASLAFAACHPEAHMYGFEAFGKTHARAMENLEENPQFRERIHLYCQALSDHSGTEIWNLGDNAGGSGKYLPEGLSTSVEVRRASETLAPIADAHLGWPCVVKMDCEGGEYAILDDWENSGFYKRIDLMVMEYHEIGGHKVEEIEDWSRRNGFMCVCKPQIDRGKRLNFGDMVLVRMGG